MISVWMRGHEAHSRLTWPLIRLLKFASLHDSTVLSHYAIETEGLAVPRGLTYVICKSRSTSYTHKSVLRIAQPFMYVTNLPRLFSRCFFRLEYVIIMRFFFCGVILP